MADDTGLAALASVATPPISATPAPHPSALTAGIGLAVASVAFAATFRGPRARFWQRMTTTGLTLGSYALLTGPAARKVRIRPVDVALGLGSAVGLYVIFAVGDRFARRMVPGGDEDIREIYALRTVRPRSEIAVRLASIIGPAEELFWRGLVTDALMARLGRWPGAALGALAYAGVHVPSGNFTLFGAAGIAGAYWSALHAAGMPLGALVVSHVAWDIWIFLVQPTGETDLIATTDVTEAGEASARASHGVAGRASSADAVAGSPEVTPGRPSG